MAKTVREIMNRELFSLRPSDSVAEALDDILALDITGAPVLDEKGQPLGMVSLRDLAGRSGLRAAGVMTSPAEVVEADALIPDAARRLAETGRHRLVVVEGDGRAIGMVSSLDVLRGLIGLPAPHPAAFPHLDPETRLTWTDDAPLDLEHLEAAPDGPGVLVLVRGGAAVHEHAVWIESCENVYTRLTDLLAEPQTDEPVLAWWLAHGPLRFRAAPEADPDRRRIAVDLLRARLRPAASLSGTAIPAGEQRGM